MNILIVPSWYRNESNSIMGSFFREQALSLSRAGHNVYIADATFQKLSNLKSKRLFRLCKYDDDGLRVYSFVVPSFGISRSANGGISIFYSNLKKIYKEMLKDGIKIDVIHAHVFFPAGFAAVKLGKEFNIPVVVTEHNSLVLTGQLQPRRIRFLKETVENADRFICVSEALKDSVVRLTDTDRQIDVIPNVLNSIFNYEEKRFTKSFTFLSVGNFVESKRFDLTIRAFAEFFKKNPLSRLVLAGDGPLRKTLENMVQELGIGEAVIFKGRLSREEVRLEFVDCSVFVLPSNFETFGVVYIEALACGCPVIATKNGGANSLINETNGLLIDIDDEQQLSEAMNQIFEKYSDYDLEKISRECCNIYSESKFVSQLSELYNQI